MRLEQIDKNFKIEEGNVDGLIEYSLPNDNFGIYGIFYDKERGSFARAPYTFTKQFGIGLDTMAGTTAGGRIKFSTDSMKLGLKVKWRRLIRMSHMPLTGSIGFYLLEELDDGKRIFIKPFMATMSDENGMVHNVEFSDGVRPGYSQKKMRNFIIYCPLYNEFIEEISIFLEKDAKVNSGKSYKDVKPILYYGSSITQGGCVSRPDNSFPALIEQWTNIDFINLGFSGNAKGEPEMAEYLSKIECSIFVCDYDYNAPNVEHLLKTHLPLYRMFRNAQPNTPIVFVSAPVARIDLGNVRARKDVIYNTYKTAKNEGDQNVYFIDGASFFGDDAEFCTVDGCHPNDLGHYKMAKAIYPVITSIMK